MSSFWGAEVKPGKPYTHTHSARRGRLRLTQATLGGEPGKVEKGGGGKKSVVQLQCSVKNKDPVFLCALVSGQSETCHLELEFEENYVTFSVLGQRSVHLVGYYIDDVYEEIDDSDTGSDSLQGSDDDAFLDTDDDDTVFAPASLGEMSSDGEDDADLEFDLEDDDSEMIYNQPRSKSSVVIEEIQEDDRLAGGGKNGSNKKQTSENGDDSKLQLAVRVPAESLESEDDGFPASFSEAKKSTEGGSKKKGNLNTETSTEDWKRKSSAVSDHHDLSGEAKAENDGGLSKNKRKPKAKKTAADIVEKESKQQDSLADLVDAKQKKNKNKKSLEAGTHHADKENHVHDDVEEVTAQDTNKRKRNKKKKTQEKKTSENHTPTDLMESESKKQPLQTRTFANGMVIQEIAMGKPDGTKASPGKKVSVKYTGMLKNGMVFDSTVGQSTFDFRLGVGEAIRGWDVGINGMRVGDKRRLTIPPSLGYGSQMVGKIPQNSTLVFDVELVNAK